MAKNELKPSERIRQIQEQLHATELAEHRERHPNQLLAQLNPDPRAIIDYLDERHAQERTEQPPPGWEASNDGRVLHRSVGAPTLQQAIRWLSQNAAGPHRNPALAASPTWARDPENDQVWKHLPTGFRLVVQAIGIDTANIALLEDRPEADIVREMLEL